MVVARTRSERLRTWAAGVLAFFYVLAFLPLAIRGAATYLEWWFGLQMIVGAAAIWLYPRELRRRRPLSAARAGERSILVNRR